MDFIENVKTVVSDTAQTVVKKSGELVEASKIKYAIYDLNNEVNKLYAEIGQMVYKARMNDEEPNGNIEEKFIAIKKKKEEIDRLSGKMSGIKNKITCVVCGRICKADSKFCPYCGEEFAAEGKVED